MTRGDDRLPKPSRESLREVKREARQRQRARVASGAPATYGSPYAPQRPPSTARRALTLAVVVGIGAAAVWGWSKLPERRGVANDQAPVVVESFTPSPSARRPSDPFAGTRVESWPVGMAGIRAPKAVATGVFPAKEVAAAYAATRRFLRAALLDQRVLYQGQTASVHAAMQRASVRAWRDDDFAQLATRFEPGIEAASPVVKVNGRISPARFVEGALQVRYSYSTVYALREKGTRDEPVLVTVRRYGVAHFGRGQTLPWISHASYISSHSDCERKWPYTGYVPTWLEPREDSGPQPTTTANLLDPDESPPPSGRCLTNSGEL